VLNERAPRPVRTRGGKRSSVLLGEHERTRSVFLGSVGSPHGTHHGYWKRRVGRAAWLSRYVPQLDRVPLGARAVVGLPGF
jgi:hypothetical protein